LRDAPGDVASPKSDPPGRRLPGWLSGLAVVVLVYLFLVGIKLMGESFGLLGDDFARRLIASTSNPVVGLFIGVLATAIIRSSSLTTSIAVTMVAGGSLSLANAVPIVMGANIGTSVTNVLVSLIHVGRRDEFRRAFAGAIVHDLFNWCTVLVFFPLEWTTHHVTGRGYLERVSLWLTDLCLDVDKPAAGFKPLKHIIDPVVNACTRFLKEGLGLSDGWTATVLIIVSLVLLIVVLWGITKVLRSLVEGKLETVLDRYLFRNACIAYFVGMMVTAIVQSSSVTTSLVVPLLGAGLLNIRQVYPYTLGANVGTTITAFLAALAVMAGGGKLATLGFTIAMVHLLFNVHGALVFYPLRVIPIEGAIWYANLAAERPRYAAFFILGMFFALPTLVILLMQLF